MNPVILAVLLYGFGAIIHAAHWYDEWANERGGSAPGANRAAARNLLLTPIWPVVALILGVRTITYLIRDTQKSRTRATGGTIPRDVEPWPTDPLANERILAQTLAARYAHGYQED